MPVLLLSAEKDGCCFYEEDCEHTVSIAVCMVHILLGCFLSMLLVRQNGICFHWYLYFLLFCLWLPIYSWDDAGYVPHLYKTLPFHLCTYFCGCTIHKLKATVLQKFHSILEQVGDSYTGKVFLQPGILWTFFCVAEEENGFLWFLQERSV